MENAHISITTFITFFIFIHLFYIEVTIDHTKRDFLPLGSFRVLFLR